MNPMIARLLQPLAAGPRQTFGFRVALHAAIGILSAAVIFSDIARRPAKPDESCWIVSSIHYSNLLESGNFYWRDWACSACGIFDARYNPHVGRWILALPLDRERWQVDPDRMCYDFRHSRAWNQANGRLPDGELLLAARRNVAWAGVGVVSTLAVVGHVAAGPLGAVVTAALALESRLFRSLAVTAQTDMQYNLFLAGLGLVLVLAVRRWQRWGSPLLLGVLAGLAASVKVSAAVFVFCLCVPVLVWRARAVGGRASFAQLTVIGFATWLTLVAVNPFYWPDVTTFDSEWFEYDVRHWLEAGRKPPVEHMAEISNWLRPFEVFFVLDRWRALLEFQRARREHLWRDNRLRALNEDLWTRFNRLWLEGVALVVLVGLCATARHRARTVQMAPRLNVGSGLAVAWFALASWLFIALFMQVNWPRYYLPATLALKLAAAVGFAWIVRESVGHLAESLVHRSNGKKPRATIDG